MQIASFTVREYNCVKPVLVHTNNLCSYLIDTLMLLRHFDKLLSVNLLPGNK